MIFICHVVLNDKVRSKLVSYLRRKFQVNAFVIFILLTILYSYQLKVIHVDALSRADTTKRTVRRNYLNRLDYQLLLAGPRGVLDYSFGAGLDNFLS